MRIDGLTDRTDETNCSFLQFCESYKNCLLQSCRLHQIKCEILMSKKTVKRVDSCRMDIWCGYIELIQSLSQLESMNT
jgi:hypothetical protein